MTAGLQTNNIKSTNTKTRSALSLYLDV